MEFFYYKSPVGFLEIICENKVLISLKIAEEKLLSDKQKSQTYFIKKVKKQLEEYFSGKRKTFEININPKGSAFQKKVWEELRKIPYGKTANYSEIAQKIGNKNAQRAVGSACNKNPILIIIPCHRVISKNGKLSGFACGVDVKEKLLEFEKM